MTPKWLRSRYQYKKEIKRRFVEEYTKEYLKVLINEEIKIVFGDRSGIKPTGLISVKGA